jgi:hypothetical protein
MEGCRCSDTATLLHAWQDVGVPTRHALTARSSGCDCDGNRANRLFQNSSIGKPLPRVVLLPVPLPMADSRWRPGAGPPNPLPELPDCCKLRITSL